MLTSMSCFHDIRVPFVRVCVRARVQSRKKEEGERSVTLVLEFISRIDVAIESIVE